MSKNIDVDVKHPHIDAEYAVCPNCGAKHGDCWEWNHQEEWQDTDCEDCGETYETCASYDVQYISRTKDKE